MTVAWLAPAALFGLAMAALPIAIHLLARRQARTLPFPSLRFLRQTQLSALRRRRIEDVVLLACRVAIVALAAAALAGPVVQSPARTAAYAARISRAVVVMGSVPAERIESLRPGAFQFASFQRMAVADAIADATGWLNAQAASAREVIFVGSLRRGDVDESDLRLIPAEIGLRFDATSATAQTDVTIGVLARRNGALVRIDRATELGNDTTRVAEGQAHVLAPDTLSILAGNQRVASAALDAVLSAGVPWRDFDRKVVIAWEDADAAAVTRAAGAGARIVSMAVPQPIAASADALMRVLREVSPPETIEPARIPEARLRQWTRSPGPPSQTAPLIDEGDRRWLWLGALLMLIVEWRLRQSRTSTSESTVIANDEVRVA